MKNAQRFKKGKKGHFPVLVVIDSEGETHIKTANVSILFVSAIKIILVALEIQLKSCT